MQQDEVGLNRQIEARFMKRDSPHQSVSNVRSGSVASVQWMSMKDERAFEVFKVRNSAICIWKK
jgi:hypothetical protein